MKILLVTLVSLITVFFLIGLVAKTQAAISFNNGNYINLCGTGTNATDNTCQRGCDINQGSCKANSSTVVKFICDGKTTDCRQNENGFASSQQIGNPGCGKTVQIDVFNKNCRAGGGWNCSDTDLQDYIVWYSGDCSTTQTKTVTSNQTQSCRDVQPLTILFKKSNSSEWINGASMTANTVQQGEEFEVNCFVQNGSNLLPGGVIEVTSPQGEVAKISNTAELRNYRSFQSGTHIFRCVSTTISNCSISDSIVIKAPTVSQTKTQTSQKPSLFDRFMSSIPHGSANPTPIAPSPSPTPSPSPQVEHQSRCQDLVVAGGNDSLVPATVTLRAQASDNRGTIQLYRFYFGDGSQTETSNPETQHRYEASGTFNARVDIKDSQGNWKTDSACQTEVRIKASPVESHKSNCSDLIIEADNNGKAPSKVTVKVNGFDNKGNLQKYKIDFGNGVIQESTQPTFTYTYQTAGTYVVKSYVQDSQNSWIGGENNCKRTLYINTEPLTKQPETGTPTLFTLGSLISGVGGLSLRLWQTHSKKTV